MTTALCIGVGLLIAPAVRQKDAVAWVVNNGGSVAYESPPNSHRYKWLSERIGRDYFDSIIGVALVAKRIKDVRPLASLPHLRQLNLSGNRIDDISPLAGLVRIEKLNLDANRVKDITALAGMERLEVLLADSNFISDVTPLFTLSHLTEVSLRGNYVSSQELDRLRTTFPDCKIAPTTARPGLDGLKFSPSDYQ